MPVISCKKIKLMSITKTQPKLDTLHIAFIWKCPEPELLFCYSSKCVDGQFMFLAHFLVSNVGMPEGRQC